MAKIHINNPKQVINGGAKKYYFKVKGLGGPKGDKGDTGATGPQGPQGPQGNAATVSVGSTTTLPVGQDATVQNVGTLYNAVLNFGIPQGPRGPQGATGATGAKGDKGDQGNPGPQGEKGTNATVYVGTTTTTNPGTQARVYNSGTDSNAVLNFEIPRGDVGPSVPLVQETGNSTTKAMSQNATTEALNGKQNTLTAGSNITISGNTISAKDTTYTAGDNVQINGTVISATDTTYTAGANIQIENGIISATDTTYTAGNGLNLNGTEFSADTDVLATKADLEGYYTKPETDNLLAPKLEAEVVAELPATGTEGKLYLTPKAHTTSTATGNPIEATITAQAGQLESFQLDGDTFQQSYTGKNLLDIPNISTTSSGVAITVNNGVIGCTGTVTASWGFNIAGANIAVFSKALPAGYYAVSLNKKVDIPIKVVFTDSESQTIGTTTITAGETSVAYTIPREAVKATVWSNTTQNTQVDISGLQIMVESGSSATSFEPFVGGQPSPSPEYPQPIQTVTGEQTVSINGTDYPIDLGSIELCKLGTYQDYIYKDGNGWKVHKAIKKTVFDQNSGWAKNQFGTNAYNVKTEDIFTAVAEIGVISPQFTAKPYDGRTDAVKNIIFADSNAGMAMAQRGISIRNTAWSDLTSFITWVTSNPVTVYYVLATSTDTTITDQTLIAQLEAIRTAILENGTNTITNTATGTNLAGDMEIGYYGFNPTNRYDKWLWLDINNNYEQIGSE